MRALIFVLLLSGCVTTSDVYLADGSKGHNIGCGGAVQNISACMQRAGEICGASGYEVVNREGEAVPFSTVGATPQGLYGQSGAVVTRNLFIRCKGHNRL